MVWVLPRCPQVEMWTGGVPGHTGPPRPGRGGRCPPRPGCGPSGPQSWCECRSSRGVPVPDCGRRPRTRSQFPAFCGPAPSPPESCGGGRCPAPPRRPAPEDRPVSVRPPGPDRRRSAVWSGRSGGTSAWPGAGRSGPPRRVVGPWPATRRAVPRPFPSGPVVSHPNGVRDILRRASSLSMTCCRRASSAYSAVSRAFNP